MWFLITTALLFSSAFAHEGHDHNKVELKVYYESLCRDSIKFFKEQLTLPYYESFKNYISVQFIPFGPVGKATQRIVNGTYSFTCQHGETECYGNIVQACAISTLQTEKNKMELISCLMSSLPEDVKTVTNQSYPTRKCLMQFELRSDELEECLTGPNGLIALSRMANLTADAHVESVPSVAVNGVMDKNAVTNLRSTVCSKLEHKNLTECSGTGGTATTVSSAILIGIVSFLRAIIFS